MVRQHEHAPSKTAADNVSLRKEGKVQSGIATSLLNSPFAVVSRSSFIITQQCLNTFQACRYFTQRFPELLLTAYSFALTHCSNEPLLQKYFPISAKDFPFASAAVAGRLAQKKKELPQGPPMLKVTPPPLLV